MVKTDGRLIMAARQAERFHVDPLVLLRDSEEYARLIRQACYEIVVEDERRRNEAEKSAARRKG